MKLTAMMAMVVALAAIQPADAQRSRSRAAPKRSAQRPPADPVFPAADFQAAFKETLFCGGTSQEPAPENCQSTWRGISWHLKNGNVGEIKPSVGTPWLFECKYDNVEDEERCFFRTGDAFAVILVGNRILVTWGYRRLPGSDLVARFDDDAPLRTAAQDGWTWSQSEGLMRKMLYKSTLSRRTPRRVSRLRITLLSAGCVMPSLDAARVKLPASATAAKAARSSMDIRIIHAVG